MHTRMTASLRRGRVNSAGARYFITICSQRRNSSLTAPDCAAAISGVLDRLEADGDLDLLAHTIMPDHIHVLAILSGKLSISQVVGKLKTLTKPALRIAGANWQDNFFEHRLRPEEAAGIYALYIFLNPYRAHLIQAVDVWPFWKRANAHGFDFVAQLINGKLPPVEWLTSDIEALGLRTDDVGVD